MSFQSPFLPGSASTLGPPSTQTQSPPSQPPSWPHRHQRDAHLDHRNHDPTETTEFFKTWAYGEQLSILKWFKGIAGGIAVAFLVASMFCCWAPCIYWYYGGDFTHQDGLDDMTDAILHGQFVPEGGWLPWFRERFAALSQTFEERAEARRRAAVEEGVRVDEAAGDANGYEQNTGMASARNRNEHRETERYSQT
ncbi:hypothetical protein Ct61P_13758 [Colletotrichum tofieldiae]|nr:hypothetical protein Ct61P_13758 [Colletotrichum tofieldiae]